MMSWLKQKIDKYTGTTIDLLTVPLLLYIIDRTPDSRVKASIGIAYLMKVGSMYLWERYDRYVWWRSEPQLQPNELSLD